MNDLQRRLENLSPERRRLVIKKLQEQKLLPSASKRNSNIAHNFVDLDAEAVLDSTISPATVATRYSTESTSIFLTGATGFLGAHLLHELLQQTSADIYCLVRASDMETGKQRLRRKLKSYMLWNDDVFNSRVTVVIGELSQPLLGLSEKQFQYLANQIDVIFHNGAWVDFIYPYSVLKPTNVLGTQEILRLATRVKTKPVHYVSTLAVFDPTGYSNGQIIKECDIPEYNKGFYTGYAQSKWVAEKVVDIACSRGLTISIYRPGSITGHSKTGVFNTDDIIYRVLKGSVQLGMWPRIDTLTYIAPVDYVSRAIVHLSSQEKSLGNTFHLITPNPLHLSNLDDWFNSLNYPIQQVSYETWRAELMHRVENPKENALYNLLPLLSIFPGKIPQIWFDSQNTLEGLQGTDIMCPPIDGTLLETYHAYTEKVRFLDV